MVCCLMVNRYIAGRSSLDRGAAMMVRVPLAFILVFGVFLMALGVLAFYAVRWGRREDRRRDAGRRPSS